MPRIHAVDQAFKSILKSDLVNHQLATGISIVVDGAPDWPIVLAIHEHDDDEDSIFKPGDIRYEVSDGLPEHRNDSFNFPTFLEAAIYAVALQKQYGGPEEPTVELLVVLDKDATDDDIQKVKHVADLLDGVVNHLQDSVDIAFRAVQEVAEEAHDKIEQAGFPFVKGLLYSSHSGV